ncbi:hypothetical protein PCAR4_390063 [Paraburkholderia caribensis]|nr:hypothetical protein PCAR4_390063 [Paraburkholderia caribensis]
MQTDLGMPASARPLTIRKGMTPDATRPLMGSSRTRYQRAGRSGYCGTRLCALRMKINPAPARLDVKAGFLQNHQPFTSLIACLESRHIRTSPTAADVSGRRCRVSTDSNVEEQCA